MLQPNYLVLAEMTPEVEGSFVVFLGEERTKATLLLIQMVPEMDVVCVWF